ncbi:hypothetical protein FOMPIDRAFT_1022585, partial [Fomitopsis schrenkii]
MRLRLSWGWEALHRFLVLRPPEPVVLPLPFSLRLCKILLPLPLAHDRIPLAQAAMPIAWRLTHHP